MSEHESNPQLVQEVVLTVVQGLQEVAQRKRVVGVITPNVVLVDLHLGRLQLERVLSKKHLSLRFTHMDGQHGHRSSN